MPLDKVYRVVIKVINPDSGRDHQQLHRIVASDIESAIEQARTDACAVFSVRDCEVLMAEKVGWDE